MEQVEVNGHQLTVISRARWADAHPGDLSSAPDDLCHLCVWVQRADTGELVLLWYASGTWVVNRADKNYDRQRKELMETAPT